MTDDPAVRSVRIAVALTERFGELLKGPHTVVSHQQKGALFGVSSGSDEELSLRIGEVQQIYPEIWRHLDEGRDAFAKRGVDVTTFDSIREQEGIALGANVDIKGSGYSEGNYGEKVKSAYVKVRHSAYSGGDNHGYDTTIKSANFNKAGYQRARQCADALMKATPNIDWAAIAKAEANDPNIAAFTKATKTKRYFMYGVLAFILSLPFIYVFKLRRDEANAREERAERWEEGQRNYKPPSSELDDKDRALLQANVTRAQATMAGARDAWKAAFAPDALAKLVPGANPCEHVFVAPNEAQAASFIKYDRTEGGWEKAQFYSWTSKQPVTDDLLVDVERIVENLDAKLKDGTAAQRDKGKLDEMPLYFVIFVIERDLQPVVEGGSATSGAVAGKAYVWSVLKKRIVCTGNVDVKNTPAGDLGKGRADERESAMQRELEVRIRQALAPGLKAI